MKQFENKSVETSERERLLALPIRAWIGELKAGKSMPEAESITKTIMTFFKPSSSPGLRERMGPFYVWLRDESIRSKKRTVNNPMSGIETVKDLVDLFEVTSTRDPFDKPWIWLGGSQRHFRETIDKVEKTLKGAGLLR